MVSGHRRHKKEDHGPHKSHRDHQSNNPTGALYPKEVLQQIVDVAREHQLIIFSDEIYDRLVMDDAEHVSIASMHRTSSASPSAACPNPHDRRIPHRLDDLKRNKKAAKDYIEGLKMLSNMRLCSNVPAQSIVQTALGGHQSVRGYIAPGGRVREQRDYIYKALTDIRASAP